MAHISTDNTISKFYDDIAFPGYYTIEQLDGYGTPIENLYLNAIDQQLGHNQTVLDAGCGTGLTTNLFARRHTTSKFTGVDFAKSVDWATTFAKKNNISNVTYQKCDLTKYTTEENFDVVICQGVLHHIPEYQLALSTLMGRVKDNGTLILGLYHPWGKLVKKLANIDYQSTVLYKDQEQNPFESSFTYKQVEQMTPGFKIIQAMPNALNTVSIPAFFNYRNGGLVIYILKKEQL